MPFSQFNSPANHLPITWPAVPLEGPPITPAVYQRVFRLVHGALLAVYVDPSTTCSQFAYIASAILHRHHGVIAIPVAGAATFQVDTDGRALGYWTADDDGQIWSDDDAFHCWLNTPSGWILDFQAPLHSASYIRKGGNTALRHFMFQRHLCEQSETLLSVAEPGDFHFEPNLPLTDHLEKCFFANRMDMGLLASCVDWYRAPPTKLATEHRVTDADGVERMARLSPIRIKGAW